MTRGARQLALAVATGLACALAWWAGPAANAVDRLSLLTAWACLILMAAALLLGPLHARRRGQPLLNHVARRDLGIWSAIAGLAHLVAATDVVMTPAYFRTYISGPPDDPMPGWAGQIGTASIIAGYVIGVLLLRLLAISNDRSLRRLGPQRWKRGQRLAYLAFALTAAHGIVFQLVERRVVPWVALLLALVAVVAALQVAGRRAVLSRSARRQP